MQSVTLCHAVPFSPFQKMFCPARRVCGLLGSPGGGAAGCAVNSVDLVGILTHGGRKRWRALANRNFWIPESCRKKALARCFATAVSAASCQEGKKIVVLLAQGPHHSKSAQPDSLSTTAAKPVGARTHTRS